MTTPITPTTRADYEHIEPFEIAAFAVPRVLARRLDRVGALGPEAGPRAGLLAYLLTLGLDAYERQRAERDEATP